MLIHEEDRDFQVLIKMPSIEYTIMAKNFTFLKTLTKTELEEYLDQGFQLWDEILIKHCMQYRKFNELLKIKLSSFLGGPQKPPIGKTLNPFSPANKLQPLSPLYA